jgi:hypothetical protein
MQPLRGRAPRKGPVSRGGAARPRALLCNAFGVKTPGAPSLPGLALRLPRASLCNRFAVGRRERRTVIPVVGELSGLTVAATRQERLTYGKPTHYRYPGLYNANPGLGMQPLRCPGLACPSPSG